jgi:hypothetical protein
LRKRQSLALLFATLAVAARCPFLFSGKIAFDSDEAVEGLMARHVLHGEFPAFFWGQAFKGVPEVYAAAGAFAVFGPTVAVLKSVALVFFALYVALNFVLLDKIADRWLAVAASLLLILSPPALVFWSLDASAEYMVVMLLGTAFLLLCVRWQKGHSRPVMAAIGLVIGLGLWVQQLFVFYLIPCAAILLLGSEWWASRGPRRAATDVMRATARPVAVKTLIRVLSIVAIVYLGLALVAFATGGFSLEEPGVTLGVRAPQKLLRVALAAGGLAVLLFAVWSDSTDRHRWLLERARPLGLGFIVGQTPTWLHTIFHGAAYPPERNANLWQLIRALPDIVGNIIPILAGFKMATTERLPLPLIAVVPGALAALTYLWSNRRRLIGFARLRPIAPTLADDFIPLFVVFVPLLFLVSGAYLDTQSYRYLIPWYAGLSVAWAAGCLVLARRNAEMASILLAAVLAIHAWQQAAWYRELTPDAASQAMVDCLRRHDLRGGFADYWTSYKLTFLSNEQIIIAPNNGTDRYPAYTAFIRSLPAKDRIGDAARCH